MSLITRASRKQRLVSIVFCVCGLAGVSLIISRSVLEHPCFPVCPMHRILGLLCPGCGTLRAMHSLLHGDVIQALAFNSLFVLLCPWLALWSLNHAACALSGMRLVPVRVTSWLGWTVLAVVLVFAVLRNIPVDAFAYLAPHHI